MDCIGCTEAITHRALLECGHSSACPLCILRLRLLLHDNRCPECRHTSEMVFVANDGTYEQYSGSMWGDRSMNGFKEYEASKVFFQTEEMWSEFVGMMLFTCQLCAKDFKAQNSLLSHLQSSHGLTMCDLCLAHKTVFISEQELFTPEELRVHKEEGDPETGSPHPRCRLCSRFVYDDKALIQHIRDQHYFCDLCPQEARPAFAGYDSLERHYDKYHFLCAVTTCKRAKHVVYATWDELISHHRNYHPGFELPVFKPSFRGAGEEYIPRSIPEAPQKRPDAMSEERKNEEFPALAAVKSVVPRGPWGDESDPLNKLGKTTKKRPRRQNPTAQPTVILNPITFQPVPHTKNPADSEEAKAWPPVAPSKPVQSVAPIVSTKSQKHVYTPKDFPSLVSDDPKPSSDTITVESQVALLNRKQISKEIFIEWLVDAVPKDKISEQFQHIYAGLSDRRLAESVVAGIEGRAKQSKKDMMESDFPALMSAVQPKPAKKHKEKKQKQQGSAWTAQPPRSAEPAVRDTDFPTLPVQQVSPKKPDFPELPSSSSEPRHTVPEHVRIVKDNLSLLAARSISREEFVQAYLQVVPHLQQLSNDMLKLLKAANQDEIIQELWVRVDKCIPARTAVLDKYKEELDAQLHLFRYSFITREKFVEEYVKFVEPQHWVHRELLRYIRVSVPSESLIEAIEQRHREQSVQYAESQYPALPKPKNSKKAK